MDCRDRSTSRVALLVALLAVGVVVLAVILGPDSDSSAAAAATLFALV